MAVDSPGFPNRSSPHAFIGRERELGELRAGLDDAAVGSGRLFLIVGEPGIGKTRLAEEISAAASERGTLVAWGRCWEDGGAPAYWPWVQILRRIGEEITDQELSAALGDAAPQLAALAPELAARLGVVADASRRQSLESEHERFPLFDAATAFLRRVAAARPLVLVLDDLHASDEPSLLLLEFLARDLRGSRLLVLGTYRDVEAQRHAERARLLNASARCGHRVPLGGLSEADVERLVRAALASSPSTPEARLHELAERVFRNSEGNPFFIDEILRLLLAEPNGGATELKIPHGIRETVRERLRPLSPACRRALAAAAVIGREFDLTLLQPLAAESLDGEDEAGAELLDVLAAGESAGIVARQTGTLVRWAFCHALIRETLYDDLAPALRARLHWLVAETLAQQTSTRRGAEPLAELAHHYLRGASAGDPRKAVEYAMRAGETAQAQLAYEEAAACFQHALEALTLVRGDDEQTIALRRVALLLALGEAHAHAWNTTSAQQTFSEAAAQARGLHAIAPAAAPVLLARAALGYGRTGLGVPRGNTPDAILVSLLEEALARLDDTQPAMRARVLSRLAVELYFSTERERRVRLSEEAVALARRAGDLETLAYVISAQHFVLWDSPDVDRRLAIADEAVTLAQRAGRADTEIPSRLWRILDRIEKADAARWAVELDELEDVARALRQPLPLAFTATLRAARSLWRGRFDEVEAFGRQGLAIAERAQDTGAAVNYAVQHFAVQRLRGEQEDALQVASLWVQQFGSSTAVRCMRAVLLSDLGREDELREEFDRLAAADFADLQRVNGLLAQLAWLSEICVTLGDRRRGEMLHAFLEPYAENVLVGGPRVVFGPAAHWLGCLAALLGREDEAVEQLSQAAATSRAMDGPPAAAASEYELARVLIDRDDAGDHDRARTLLQGCIATASGLGMALLERRATALATKVAPRSERTAVRVAAGSAGVDAGAASGRSGSSGRVLRFPAKGGGRTATDSPRLGPAPGYALQREGEFWTVSDGDTLLRLKDSKGLGYLAQLLRHPDREFHALDLIAPERGIGAEGAHSGVSEKELHRLGMHSASDAEVGDKMLDARARGAYQQRLEDLRDELEEATRFNDTERASRARVEMEFLARELARAVGLGGRDRATSSGAERARLNVTRAIKAVIRRVGRSNPNLGRYLETTIRTGAFCSYRPDPRIRVSWRL